MRKIQWALFRKEDVHTFREEISMHLHSIQLLLISTRRLVVIVGSTGRSLICIGLRLPRKE
jgi:hypothetical protein